MIAKYDIICNVFIMDCYLSGKLVVSFRYNAKTRSMSHRSFPMQTGIVLPFYTFFRWCNRFNRICSMLFAEYDHRNLREIKRICDVVNV